MLAENVPLMSRIHCTWSSPSWTEIHLLDDLIASYKAGERTLGATLSNHLSTQKVAFLPLPIRQIVEARNTLPASGETAMPSLWRGCSMSVLDSQSHHARRAALSSLRLCIPSPPKAVGQQTKFQATLQCPTFASSNPLHRKSLHIPSNLCITQEGRLNESILYTEIDVRTDLIQIMRPPSSSNFPFQAGR